MGQQSGWVVAPQGFAEDAVLLCVEGVGNVIGSLEVGFSVKLSVQEAVVMQELDVRYDKWSGAGILARYSPGHKRRRKQCMPCWQWQWHWELAMLLPCLVFGGGF